MRRTENGFTLTIFKSTNCPWYIFAVSAAKYVCAVKKVFERYARHPSTTREVRVYALGSRSKLENGENFLDCFCLPKQFFFILLPVTMCIFRLSAIEFAVWLGCAYLYTNDVFVFAGEHLAQESHRFAYIRPSFVCLVWVSGRFIWVTLFGAMSLGGQVCVCVQRPQSQLLIWCFGQRVKCLHNIYSFFVGLESWNVPRMTKKKMQTRLI